METIFVLFLWFNCIVYKSLTCHFSLTTSVYVDLKPRVVSNKRHVVTTTRETTLTMEFSSNVFTEFRELIDKIYLSLKGLEPTNSCIRDHDATTAPARYM